MMLVGGLCVCSQLYVIISCECHDVTYLINTVYMLIHVFLAVLILEVR